MAVSLNNDQQSFLNNLKVDWISSLEFLLTIAFINRRTSEKEQCFLKPFEIYYYICTWLFKDQYSGLSKVTTCHQKSPSNPWSLSATLLSFRWILVKCHCFHFPSLSYDLVQSFWNLVIGENFWLFECNIRGEIGFQKQNISG